MLALCKAPSLVSMSRALSLSCVHQAQKGRRKQDKLKQPEDKSNIVIGKRRPPCYFPKEGISDLSHPIHVEWKRPNSMETCNAEISGDLSGLDAFGFSKLDLSQPLVNMEGSKSLENASPEVKRVLSLEFARRRDSLSKLSNEVIKSVQRHPRDFKSLEVSIALQTVKIRNTQFILIQQWPYKNPNQKHTLTHLVSSRRRNLRKLRERDYRKYEWLLEKLDLFYKPMPYDTDYGVLGRKEYVERCASVERVTDIWCDELKKHRMAAYKRKLKAQQPDFLRKKAERLKEIIEKETKYGVIPTVTEEEVSSCLRRADEIEAMLAKEKEEGEEEEYLLYREEAVREKNVYIKS